MKSRWLKLGLCVCCAWALGACVAGYGVESTYDQGIRTVAVDIFDNQTREVGIETQLSEAIIKEIQAHTPWRVTDGAIADTILTGVIRSADYRRLSRTRGIGLTQEGTFEMTVEFDFTRPDSSEVLVSRRALRGMATFAPTRGTDERAEIGQRGAIQNVARRIVDELRATW